MWTERAEELLERVPEDRQDDVRAAARRIRRADPDRSRLPIVAARHVERAIEEVIR